MCQSLEPDGRGRGQQRPRAELPLDAEVEATLQRSGVNFINVPHTAFALVDPESVKITVKSSVSFYAFGIYKPKSCT